MTTVNASACRPIIPDPSRPGPAHPRRPAATNRATAAARLPRRHPRPRARQRCRLMRLPQVSNTASMPAVGHPGGLRRHRGRSGVALFRAGQAPADLTNDDRRLLAKLFDLGLASAMRSDQGDELHIFSRSRRAPVGGHVEPRPRPRRRVNAWWVVAGVSMARRSREASSQAGSHTNTALAGRRRCHAIGARIASRNARRRAVALPTSPAGVRAFERRCARRSGSCLPGRRAVRTEHAAGKQRRVHAHGERRKTIRLWGPAAGRPGAMVAQGWWCCRRCVVQAPASRCTAWMSWSAGRRRGSWSTSPDAAGPSR
jgi:hypothetical protein